MKNLIKSKIFWFFVVVAAAVGTYFGFENNWWMENVEPVVEEVVEAPTETTEVVEIAIEETENDETNIKLNTVETNE